MPSRSRLQWLVAFPLIATWMAVSPNRSNAQPKPEAVPQAVLNLDLCTLAYQLYHQSLCLPLDPWYDQFSRPGSDRRNNICLYTHEYAKKLGNGTATPEFPGKGFYSGPNAARGWTGSNPDLHPILTNYKQVHPKLPAFTWDGENFVAIQAPAYITGNIKRLEGVRYKTKPTKFPSDEVERFAIRDYPSGDDRLIVFEGATGLVGPGDPAWSIMGFVLLRKTSAGYDAHIVFRGSRGGSTGRTVLQAQGVLGSPKGNPDWVTDLAFTKQMESTLISKVGTVTAGFGKALPTMLGPIKACCKYLQDNYPVPKHIYVTGHSLRAALASQFVSAVLLGSYGEELKKDVKGWPWDKATLIAFAQPIPGDPTWAAQFNKISPTSEHYWVAGDLVVEATSGFLGKAIDKGQQCGVQNKLARIAGCTDNSHEVFVIRGALLRDLKRGQPALPDQVVGISTWGYYESVSKMLAGKPKCYVYPGAATPIVTEANLRSVLDNCNFGPEFDRWLNDVYTRMIADRKSYIGPHFKTTLDERKKQVELAVQQMRKPVAADSTQALENLLGDFKIVKKAARARERGAMDLPWHDSEYLPKIDAHPQRATNETPGQNHPRVYPRREVSQRFVAGRGTRQRLWSRTQHKRFLPWSSDPPTAIVTGCGLLLGNLESSGQSRRGEFVRQPVHPHDTSRH